MDFKWCEKMRTEEEIRNEISRLENLILFLKRQGDSVDVYMQIVKFLEKIDSLTWVIEK